MCKTTWQGEGMVSGQTLAEPSGHVRIPREVEAAVPFSTSGKLWGSVGRLRSFLAFLHNGAGAAEPQ
jgi:hypothetical protein